MKLFLYIIIPVFLFTACSSNDPKAEITAIENDSTVYKMVNTGQMLLTNSADLKDHTSLFGASAFIINYKSDKFAITAKHLISEDGGVEPEVKLNELNSCLLGWKMFPRVPVNEAMDTIVIANKHLDYSKLNQDILILPTANSKNNIFSLTPDFTLPVTGDKLFIIGCTYADTACKQKVYEVIFDSYEREKERLIIISKNKFEAAGFSGAPLLNKKGHVIGLVTGSIEQDGGFILVATCLKAIENVL